MARPELQGFSHASLPSSYGFLSENHAFAAKVENAGIAFIGPRPETIDALGDKTKARTLAIKTGVPVVPGTPGPVASYDLAKDFIEQYGFPVIIKAAMGGGGRGMRVVRDQASFKENFERAVSEAKSAFGDGTVFIERFLDRPRHIEVQLLADSQGNCVHLFERDCSVQRRHQKVVEVAPAPHLAEEIRQAILGDAIKLANAVQYRNAGTAEFLVDQQGRHYFIEINPRIQVEHTITGGWACRGWAHRLTRAEPDDAAEEITGIDIVAAQIQIAAGASLASLGLTQEAITRRGFAIQCRITTEDAAQGFQPDTGKIEVYRSAGGNGVRLDASSGFAGAQITVGGAPGSEGEAAALTRCRPCASPTTTVCLSSARSAARLTRSPGARCCGRSSSSASVVSRWVGSPVLRSCPDPRLALADQHSLPDPPPHPPGLRGRPHLDHLY